MSQGWRWSGVGKQVTRLRQLYQANKPSSFSGRSALARLGESVVTAAPIVEREVGALVAFFNQIGFQQRFDGTIEGAWPKAHLALCAGRDFQHDAIAVAFASCQGVKADFEGSSQFLVNRW